MRKLREVTHLTLTFHPPARWPTHFCISPRFTSLRKEKSRCSMDHQNLLGNVHFLRSIVSRRRAGTHLRRVEHACGMMQTLLLDLQRCHPPCDHVADTARSPRGVGLLHFTWPTTQKHRHKACPDPVQDNADSTKTSAADGADQTMSTPK